MLMFLKRMDNTLLICRKERAFAACFSVFSK